MNLLVKIFPWIETPTENLVEKFNLETFFGSLRITPVN